jgi:hypothetical protein
LKLKLRGGKELDVPLDAIAKYGKRLPQAKAAKGDDGADAEPAAEQFTFTDPIFALRNGDRLVGKPAAERLELTTLYGPLSVGLSELKRIEFPHAELRAPLIELTDGSSFTALPTQRQLEMKTAGGATVSLDAGRLAAIFFKPAQDLVEAEKEETVATTEDAEQPDLPAPYGHLRLMNQDTFCGTLGSSGDQIAMETPFGTQRIGVDQVMRLKPRGTGPYTVRVTLWDGNVFPARLTENTIRITTNGGAKLDVPFGMLSLYWRPLALPPANEATRIEGLIAKLSDNDPQSREEAQKALTEIGHGARALLAKHWKDEDLERRTRVRRLLERLQETAPKETLEDEEDEESVTPASTTPRPVALQPVFQGRRRMIAR